MSRYVLLGSGRSSVREREKKGGNLEQKKKFYFEKWANRIFTKIILFE